MKRMFRFTAIAVAALCGHLSHAQRVPKAVLVEHFTNSYCSICAGRNPGFYQNLAQFPQALHISYYPSAPYPACPLNQYNKPEADARTNYYGVYGSTPRLVIQGASIPANANYSSSAIFQDELGKTSAFAVSLQLKSLSATSGEARLTIRKADTSSLDSVSLYAAIVEDTLLFAAHNGEQEHYNVFRRSVWGTQPLRVKAPAMVGDSALFTHTFPIDAAWTLSRMYGIGMVQEGNGALVQAARSGKLSAAAMSVTANHPESFAVYPNPATDFIRVESAVVTKGVASIYDLQGRKVQQQEISGSAQITVSQLAPGQYILRIDAGVGSQRFYFTKR